MTPRHHLTTLTPRFRFSYYAPQSSGSRIPCIWMWVRRSSDADTALFPEMNGSDIPTKGHGWSRGSLVAQIHKMTNFLIVVITLRCYFLTSDNFFFDLLLSPATRTQFFRIFLIFFLKTSHFRYKVKMATHTRKLGIGIGNLVPKAI